MRTTQLECAITHVFLPVPNSQRFPTDCAEESDHFLARAVCAAAHTFSEIVDDTLKHQWYCIAKMLDNLEESIKSRRLDKDYVISQLCGMQTGGTLLLNLQTLC